jgi:hypothetical protein
MQAQVMKITFAGLLLLLTYCAGAQGRPVSFSRIDWVVQTVDATTPEALAQQLTAPYTTDLEKVRSVFRWITEHIAYASRPRSSVHKSALRYKHVPMDTLLALKSVDEIVAYTVLQNRTAVCNGYARLFKTLCSYAGIRAEVVTGYARGGSGNIPFRSNHSWNAVYVDSAWRLVDATWASGFVSFTDEFVKHYDDSYFFPSPEGFIRSHYPEDLKWALLPNPPTLHEFYNTPFKLTAFVKYGISGYTPSRGVVEAAIGDTVQFRFALKGNPTFTMAPELNADSMLLSGVAAWDFIKPSVVANEVVYTYPVQSDRVEWIHLVYNDDIILRYKLNIRKEKP